jgi:hypothetical protein
LEETQSSLQTVQQRILRVISKETLDNKGGYVKGLQTLALAMLTMQKLKKKRLEETMTYKT